MPELPRGWYARTLEEVATLQRGFDLPVQHRKAGCVPVVASNGPVGTHIEAPVKGPGVVTGRSGTIGKVFYYDDDFWPLNTTLYVKDFHGNDPKFVAVLLEHLQLDRFAEATGVPSLNRNTVHPIPVFVPPLPEQRKIAAILSSVDDSIGRTEAVIEQLEVVRQGLLGELLTRGVPGRHTEFAETEVGPIPTGWTVVGLFDVAVIASGQVDPRKPPYRDWPLVAPNHIESGTGRLLHAETAAAQGAISGKYQFARGDVLYSKIRPYLRKAGLATTDGLCSADMYPLRPTALIDGSYLLAVLLSEPFTRYVVSASMRTGIPKVNREELAQYRFGLPPRDEQCEIARVLESLASRTNREFAALEGLRTLKAALRNALLSGQVRVSSTDLEAA